MKELNSFLQAREYLIETAEPTITSYYCGIWDPMIKFVVVKEINNIIKNDLVKKFPELNPKFHPRFKFRIYEEEGEVELSIQKYLNTESFLEYLGIVGIGEVLYDLYHRDAYDGSDDRFFIARYGHESDSYFSGSKTAEAEYYMGAMTPLAAAYSLAINDGII